MNPSSSAAPTDALLVGAGIMSANLAALLKRIDPALSISVYEVADQPAQEASDGWHNAGTGHAGICELSYTPDRSPNGTVDVSNAIKIFEQFEYSRQFWGRAVATGMVDNPSDFINPVSHVSFVHGEVWVDFLHSRHESMAAHHFFEEMDFSTEPETIGSWSPLLTDGRGDVPIAATRMESGTDVNFGSIARKLFTWVEQQPDCQVNCNHRVLDLNRCAPGAEHRWEATLKNLVTGEVFTQRAKFVFIGAGGGSLPLLQKAGVPEANGMGGFPIGGQWLVCDDPEIVDKHQAKVYGQPLDAAPTMAVPHLDTRVIDGKRTLLFGPFAAWTTKFLHEKGSLFDLPKSVRPDNLATLLKIGVSNLELVRYLLQQGTQSMEDRLEVLRVFYPDAERKDWRLIDAGIRVQAIKKTDGEAGIVHYGTEVLTSEDRSISALLGASPGASVSVHIVLEVIRTCLPHLLATEEGHANLEAMIPIADVDLKDPANASFYRQAAERASQELELS